MLKDKIKTVNEHYKSILESIYSKKIQKIKDLKKICNSRKYNNAIISLEKQYSISNIDNHFHKNNIESYIDHSLKLIDYIKNLQSLKRNQEIEQEHIKQIRLKCAKVMQYAKNISARDLSH